MKRILTVSLISLAAVACQESTKSDVKVSSVKHSPVKRQAIGNCWLYAQSTWLESLLKNTTGEDVNVSETYWTYWDLYYKLLEKQPVPEEELNTGGTWSRSSQIIKKHGWVEEINFIANESDMVMSKSQECAEDYIMAAGKEGGSLFDVNARTPELVRAELDKAFSCNGAVTFSMEEAIKKSHKAEDTMLADVKTGEQNSLSGWLDSWREIGSPGYSTWGAYEGKKLNDESQLNAFRKVEQRIKNALNDHQPVVISFFVTFNAPDKDGLFNLNSLTKAGDIGSSGGHMVVLHDYTVSKVPGEFTTLGEGDMAPELKEAALQGELDYLVAKNSWGADRPDRPWLRNGYSRLTWDYLRGRYYDEKAERFSPFLRGVVLPPGY